MFQILLTDEVIEEAYEYSLETLQLFCLFEDIFPIGRTEPTCFDSCFEKVLKFLWIYQVIDNFKMAKSTDASLYWKFLHAAGDESISTVT